jgi:hypothetical protein
MLKIKITVRKKIKITVKRPVIREGSQAKERIIQLFYERVKGKEVVPTKSHDGCEGQWLEQQMGLRCNCKNEPDIEGYEMKKESPKITFGDFSASEYLFTKDKPLIELFNQWKRHEVNISRDQFIEFFGTANPKKKDRYSWSGKCVPKYGLWNESGQTMEFNSDGDLCIYYSFDKDSRQFKEHLPSFLKEPEKVLIVIWFADKLGSRVNNKFNQKGFFICKKKDGRYEKICFGLPFNFSYFVEGLKHGLIIFDSGMYAGNTRNYSQFRSSSKVWDSMITEEY